MAVVHNLWGPYQYMKSLAESQYVDDTGMGWQRVLGLWWGAWVVYHLLISRVTSVGEQLIEDGEVSAYILVSLVDNFASIALTVAAIGAVRMMTRRQIESESNTSDYFAHAFD